MVSDTGVSLSSASTAASNGYPEAPGGWLQRLRLALTRAAGHVFHTYSQGLQRLQIDILQCRFKES